MFDMGMRVMLGLGYRALVSDGFGGVSEGFFWVWSFSVGCGESV